MVVLSKDEFVEIIDQLKEANEIKEKINDIIRNSSIEEIRDFFGGFLVCFEGIIIKLLQKILANGDDTLDWWAFECDYGKKFKIGSLIEADGTKPDLSTAEKLYDYLIELNKKMGGI